MERSTDHEEISLLQVKRLVQLGEERLGSSLSLGQVPVPAPPPYTPLSVNATEHQLEAAVTEKSKLKEGVINASIAKDQKVKAAEDSAWDETYAKNHGTDYQTPLDETYAKNHGTDYQT